MAGMTTGKGGAAGAPTVTATAARACDELARVTCDASKRCDPNFFEFVYRDMTACLAEWGNDCKHDLSLADTDYRADDVEACARASADDADCDIASGIVVPPPCLYRPGKRKPGEACQSQVQCASLVCSRTSLSARCGTCLEGAPEGGACRPGVHCGQIQSCVDGVCTRWGGVDGACNPDKELYCLGSLRCVNGTCQRPVAIDEPCQELFDCEGRITRCVNGKCVLPTLVDAGAVCDGTPEARSHWCSHGSSCEGTVCEAQPRLGQACTPGGPLCLDGAECWTGVCELPNGAYCPASGERSTP
jgi:hypothetical protein